MRFLNFMRPAEPTPEQKELYQLRIAHRLLWSAHANILEGQTAKPNGTVVRMLKISEAALINDPIADIKPTRKFTKGDR